MTANAGTTPQSATVSTAFANALAVTVLDAGSNPVAGVNVTFTAPGAGASGQFSQQHADDHGGDQRLGRGRGAVHRECHRGRTLHGDGGGDRSHDGQFLADQSAGRSVLDDGECRHDAAVGDGQHGLRQRAGGDGEGCEQQSGGGCECDVHGTG